jgi:hypothetical protein
VTALLTNFRLANVGRLVAAAFRSVWVAWHYCYYCISDLCLHVHSAFAAQGGGKRKGAFAIYIEPWHADIFEWLDLRKNHGKEEARARDLFYGLWINDLFMKVRDLA